MSKQNDSAFPLPAAHISAGLTKREYFAGLAMQGILANNHYEAPRSNKIRGMALDAVQVADALIEELSK